MRYDKQFVEMSLNNIFAGFSIMPSSDPAKCLPECIELLDRVCGDNAESEFAPLIDEGKAHLVVLEFDKAIERFARAGYLAAAESLYLSMWDRFGREQLGTRCRVYRAAIAMRLSNFYLQGLHLEGRDKGAATRWALYTQADDMLGRHIEGGGQGKKTLQAILGMTPTELEELNRFVAENLEIVNSVHGGDWSRPAGFAEDAVRRFAIERPAYAHLFAEPSSLPEFRLSQPYFSTLLSLYFAV